MPAGSVSGESSLPGCKWPPCRALTWPLLCACRERSLVSLLIKTLILSHPCPTPVTSFDTIQCTALGVEGFAFSVDPFSHTLGPQVHTQAHPMSPVPTCRVSVSFQQDELGRCSGATGPFPSWCHRIAVASCQLASYKLCDLVGLCLLAPRILVPRMGIAVLASLAHLLHQHVLSDYHLHAGHLALGIYVGNTNCVALPSERG